MQPAAQPPCFLVPSQRPLACVQVCLLRMLTRSLPVDFATLHPCRAAFGSLSLCVRLCRPTGCLRQAVLVRTPPRCLTLRAAYAAYRATALLLGSQPAPAGMCSGFSESSPACGASFHRALGALLKNSHLPHFRSPVSNVRFLLSTPPARPLWQRLCWLRTRCCSVTLLPPLGPGMVATVLIRSPPPTGLGTWSRLGPPMTTFISERSLRATLR